MPEHGIDIRQTFTSHCGDGSKYVSHSGAIRDDCPVISIRFDMVPEGRQFELDGVIHGPARHDLRNAVVRIATIARDIREHLG